MTGFDPTQIQVNLPKKKYKIITLCDHPLSTSGVGVQAGALFNGLIQTGKYSFKSLGGALKHADYKITSPHPDLIIKPVDGFGTKEELLKLLLTEQPDAVFLFTDPRQFMWVWEMSDEIRQICPIVYWHVWDNDPVPMYNKVWYESTDLINCLSYKTFEMVSKITPDRAKYIPHTFPKEMYYPLPQHIVDQEMQLKFGPKADWFKVLWVNRNATRKMPADVIACFSEFLDELERKHGHRKALLVMHTDPTDMEGPNLFEVKEHFQLNENILFSVDKIPADGVNLMHNLCDTLINIAKAEGFGLSTLIQMMVGKPIIALTTGGLTRQVIDWRDGTENGVAIPPAARQLVGAQITPYIYEDLTEHSQVVNALMKVYEMTPSDKIKMKQKVLEYVDFEFKYENMIKSWDSSLEEVILKHHSKQEKTWTLKELKNPNKVLSLAEQVLKDHQISAESQLGKLPVDITGYLLKQIKISKNAETLRK